MSIFEINIHFKIKEKLLKEDKLNGGKYFSYCNPIIFDYLTKLNYKCIETDELPISEEDIKLIKSYIPKNIDIKQLLCRGSGVPDLICIKNNKIKFIEVKRNGESLTMNQLLWINEYYKSLNIEIWRIKRYGV